MNNLHHLSSFGPREETIRLLQEMIPEAVRSTADQLGHAAVIAFFDGYKDSQEALKSAA